MGNKKGRVTVDLTTGAGLIIERAHLLTALRKTFQSSWGVASWLVWLDLVRPLLMAGLWYLGYTAAQFQLYYLEGIRNSHFFGTYSLFVVLLFAVLFGWNRYNFYRYRGTDRRRPKGECGPDDLARYYGMTLKDIEELSNSSVAISFHPQERISIETATGKTIHAVYAPQNLDRHFEGPVLDTEPPRAEA